MDVDGWNITVAGAALCLAYGWFLRSVSHIRGMDLSRAGLAIGLVGIAVLTGMALVKPKSDSLAEIQTKKEIAEPMPDSKYERTYEKLVSLHTRTRMKHGPRPSSDYHPYEYPDGTLAWVLKDEYLRLREEEMEEE